MEQAAVRPILAPIGFTAGLLAFGGTLAMMFVVGDPMSAIMGSLQGPGAAPIMGIAVVGLLASILAYARKERGRLLWLGLLMSVSALFAKFFVVAIFAVLIVGLIGAFLNA